MTRQGLGYAMPRNLQASASAAERHPRVALCPLPAHYSACVFSLRLLHLHAMLLCANRAHTASTSCMTYGVLLSCICACAGCAGH